MPASTAIPVPGTCYKFTVRSADEAAGVIRDRLGPDARVLTVRSVEPAGLSKLWKGAHLEVVAQIGPPASVESAPEDYADEDEPAAESALALRPETNAPVRTRTRFLPRPAADLASLLRKSGLSEIALGRLQETPRWAELAAAPLHRALTEVGAHIRDEADRRWRRASLRRAAFIGTPGVGRTTALCKWLGLEVFRRARIGHVVTAEFDRPHSAGVLPIFCEALGVPVARFPASTHPATPDGFAYLDLPGMSLQGGDGNRALAKFLAAEAITDRVLVLNAAYDHATLRAAYGAGRDLGATHVVFTHLDEVPQWGRLWDYLLDGALEPLFLGTGPSLTGDCEEDVFAALVRRTLAGADASAAADPETSVFKT